MRAYLFEIIFVAREEIILPASNKGRVFRGTLGRSLKRHACPSINGVCSACHYMGCLYHDFFCTTGDPLSEKLSGNRNLQRPFVIRAPLDEKVRYIPGDEIMLQMILFGKSVSVLPFLIAALRDMAGKGFGSRRGRCILERVTQSNPVSGMRHGIVQGDGPISFRDDLFIATGDFPPDGARHITMRFRTPMILKDGGEYVSVPTFGAIVRRLRDRYSSLSWFYEGVEPQIDFKNYARDAERVRTVRADIRYQRASRRNSCNAYQDMSGFVGTIEFEGPVAPYLPHLLFGQYMHLGKATAFGYGWYEMEIG
jgi:hypothetical protein